MNQRIKAAWEGRISGCLLGKPVEILSMREGKDSLESYLKKSNSFPLRDYVNHLEHPLIKGLSINCCKGKIVRAEQDDDITYTVLALMMLEEHGLNIDTDDSLSCGTSLDSASQQASDVSTLVDSFIGSKNEAGWITEPTVSEANDNLNFDTVAEMFSEAPNQP